MPLPFKFTETSRQLNVLSFINVPLLALSEPYPFGIQSNFIGRPCYHYWDELTQRLHVIDRFDEVHRIPMDAIADIRMTEI